MINTTRTKEGSMNHILLLVLDGWLCFVGSLEKYSCVRGAWPDSAPNDLNSVMQNMNIVYNIIFCTR